MPLLPDLPVASLNCPHKVLAECINGINSIAEISTPSRINVTGCNWKDFQGRINDIGCKIAPAGVVTAIKEFFHLNCKKWFCPSYIEDIMLLGHLSINWNLWHWLQSSKINPTQRKMSGKGRHEEDKSRDSEIEWPIVFVSCSSSAIHLLHGIIIQILNIILREYYHPNWEFG